METRRKFVFDTKGRVFQPLFYLRHPEILSMQVPYLPMSTDV